MLNYTKPLYPLLLASAKSDPESAHRQMLDTLNNIETNRVKRALYSTTYNSFERIILDNYRLYYHAAACTFT